MPDNSSVDVVLLITFLATVTTMAMQGVKALIELAPALTTASNKSLHDWLLRAVQYAINFGLLFLASLTLPALFAGWRWWDLLSVAMGQGVLSHVQYSIIGAGGSDTKPDPPISIAASDALPVVPR